MKQYTSPLGRMHELKHKNPDRTAYRSGSGIFSDITFQVWPNRESMAKSIRMQERREYRQGDWKPIVALQDGEGY